ncbi:integrase arm-type DNA-binding domain-containing protein, partial [uncultured Paraglaciecola sp.]|uniref:tyrosine-type recombinase/integrase n=1 Tax=uncultured Paraglaciecola sp. TaxID=1765024 RepID=UPI0026386855
MPTQLVNKLTVAAVRKAQPKDKPYTLFDGKGLHVLVAVSGSKTWRLQITFEGVRRPMSIGVYPAMTLENARTKAEHLRALAARGIDPRPARHTPMAELKEATGATPFDQLAKDYWKGRAGLKSGYSETVLSALESYAFPFLAGIPVDTIDRRLALRPLEILHKQGKMEYLKKVRGWTSQVFEYAIEIGEATNNPLGGLNIKRTFGTAKKKPQPHVPQTEVGELWSRLAMEPDDDYGVINRELSAQQGKQKNNQQALIARSDNSAQRCYQYGGDSAL